MDEILWSFATDRVTVRCTAVYDPDADLSFDDGQTARAIDAGELSQPFGAVVTVSVDGHELGDASLWGNVYAQWADFVRGDNRNFYFRDLVREAINNARISLRDLRALPLSDCDSISDAQQRSTREQLAAPAMYNLLRSLVDHCELAGHPTPARAHVERARKLIDAIDGRSQ